MEVSKLSQRLSNPNKGRHKDQTPHTASGEPATRDPCHPAYSWCRALGLVCKACCLPKGWRRAQGSW
eukprot:1882887-Prymnesium_polylepis.1